MRLDKDGTPSIVQSVDYTGVAFGYFVCYFDGTGEHVLPEHIPTHEQTIFAIKRWGYPCVEHTIPFLNKRFIEKRSSIVRRSVEQA